MKALLAALFTVSLHAQDLSFLEKFAVPASRKDSLQLLTPRTRDWFYYHALDQQLRGDDAAFRATMKEWKDLSENPQVSLSSKGYSVLENRQLLLQSKTDPDAVTAALIAKLELDFNHEKSSVVEAREEPSKLDPQRISSAAFEAEILKKSPDEPWQHYSAKRILTELKDLKNFSNEKRESLLKKLASATSPEALELIALCLENNANHHFGDAGVHQTLVHSQLATLLKRIPALSQSQKFSRRYLQTMRPSDESNYLRDDALYLAHLQACEDYLRELPPVFHAWKADCLWQKLLLQQKMGKLVREDLLRYLSLPIQDCPLVRKPKNSNHESIAFAQSHFDVIGGNLSGDVDDLESMLMHFLRETQDPGDFAKYIPEKTLKKLHAKAHLLKGDEDAKWTAAFNADELQELRQSSQLNFAAEQRARYSAQDEVTLLLDCKNTPRVTLRIFELDLLRYLRNNRAEPDASIELDGLVPHIERGVEFTQAPVVLHRQSIAIPELKGRGAWVVECVSGGIASRALIRKGELHPVIENNGQGQIVRLFDESQQPIREFKVHTHRETLTSQADGTLLIPYTHALGLPQQAVIEEITKDQQGPTLAKIVSLDSSQSDYELFSAFHIDREQLIADQTVRVLLQPRLLNHGQPCSLDVIKNATITVTAQLHSGATSDHVIAAKQLQATMTAEFTMPRDATHIQVKIEAQIDQPDNRPAIRLRAEQSYEINQDLATKKIYSSFFVQTKQGHRIEILGRNGEPAADWSLPITFKHRLYDIPLTINLQTSDAGVIELGELNDIESVTIDSSSIATQPYQPNSFERMTLPQVMHHAADQTVRIPLTKYLTLDDINLMETTRVAAPNEPEQHLLTRAHSDLLKIEDGQLVINKVPAGNFQLTIGDKKIPLRISPAKPISGLLVSSQRILQTTNESLLHIATTEIDAESIKIRLKHASDQTRLSVVASQFSPQPSLALAFDQLPIISPAYTILGEQKSSFLTNRLLGDEVRYVLDRRTKKSYPGNMLPRPGLLVHRANDSADSGFSYPSLLPRQGDLAKKSEADQRRKSTVINNPTEQNQNGPLYDFLAHGSAVFYDLKPNAEGIVTIARKDMPDARFLTICATEGNHYHQTSLPLEQVPVKKRARQLQRALDPAKHFIGTQRAVVLQKDQSETINNMLDARWKEYTTIDDVYQLFLSSPNNNLITFSFLPNWNILSEERKIQLYQLHACHELHLFLARKDRAFFDRIVKPNLEQKRELAFMDHYLLGHDLTEYLNQKEWRKLNAAERALLSHAIPAAAERIRREMQYEQLKFPIPLHEQAAHFTVALEGSQLSLQERADLASLGLRNQREQVLSDAAAVEQLSGIIVPSVNYVDTALSEVIADLQKYAPHIPFSISRPIANPAGTSGLDANLSFLLPTSIDVLRIKELRLTNAPLTTVLKYVCEQTRLKYEISNNQLTIRPVSDDGEDIVVRLIQVPPDFLESLAENRADNSSDPFAGPEDKTEPTSAKASVADLLRLKGVPFPENADATFNPANSTLIVKNTLANLDLIDQITAASCSAALNNMRHGPAKGLSVDQEDVNISDPFAASDSAQEPEHNPFRFEEEESEPTNAELQARVSSIQNQTQVYQESNYWKYKDNTAQLIMINRFWLDLAQWDGKGAFLSTNFMECRKLDNEMLMALALLDLPFSQEPTETTLKDDSLTIKAKEPMILFYRDTREAAKVLENSPVLVSQTFYPADYRYREENGRQIENTIVDGKFTVGTAYGAALIIANPTGETRQVQILSQIPAGAIPLEGKAMTESITREIAPYGSEQIQLSFYFPQSGEFTFYPFHVSENDTVLAYPKSTPMRVTEEDHALEVDYFYHLADDGDEKKLLDFLRTKSLFDESTDLTWMLWRLKDRAFYDQVISILNDRLFFHPDVFGFAFYHRDNDNIRRYLENSSTISAVGPWLDSPFLKVTATRDLNWFDKEFDPFINSRAHQLGNQDQLPLDMAKVHYANFLDILCHKTELSADDHLQLCYFLTLQNRTEDAILTFAKIDRAALKQHLHYDYMHCYLLFYQNQPAEAKAIALPYQKHPLQVWQNRFQSVITQADEIAQPIAAEADVVKTQNTGTYLTMAHKDDGKIVLTHQGLKETDIQLYQVDMELLFTANPFLDEKKVLHHAIRPNKVLRVALEGKETTVDLPEGFAQGNVIAAVDAGSTQVLQSINSGKFAMKTNKLLGEIQVIDRANSKSQANTYVKIYARKKDGSVDFYKDGYTDLRGKFNYREHSTIAASEVQDFAIFLQHVSLGTRVEMISSTSP